MNTPSFFRDFFQVLFSSRRFFAERFAALSSRRIFALGFTGVCCGLLVGNALTMAFSRVVMQDFLSNQEPYTAVLSSFNLNATNFVELLQAQFAYSAMLAVLSPMLAYVAPHLFGGALFLFLWLLYRPSSQFDFHRVMECAAVSLTSMAFYVVPGVGPLLALIMVGITMSRALFAQYKLVGFFKTMSIISALYLCFFLSSATFQLLSIPVARMIESF